MRYQLPDTSIVKKGQAFSIGVGKNMIQFPTNWLDSATADDLARFNILEVPDEPTPEPVPPTTEEIIASYTMEVQRRLDTFARTRNYDGILSACTYVTSSVPKFAAEGQYCVQARDATWNACYTILSDVQAGNRPMPTLNEIMLELPVLAWPA